MKKIICFAAAILLCTVSGAQSPVPKGPVSDEGGPCVTIKMVTQGPANHFFGYYGISPWNRSQTRMIFLEADFNDRLPKVGEEARICLMEVSDGSMRIVGTTRSWNMQQGAMLLWNPRNPDTEFFYNDIVDGELCSVLYNIETGCRRLFPPLSGTGHTGKFLPSVSYGRVSRMRPVVSYGGVEDPNPQIAHPDNDGVYLVDLDTGERRLLVSFRAAADAIAERHPEIRDREMWIEHVELSPDDRRLMFMPRTWGNDPSGNNLETAMYTIAVDGTDMRPVIPYDGYASHYGWGRGGQLVVTANPGGKDSDKVHLLINDDGKMEYRVIGKIPWGGGAHCCFDGTGRWIVTNRKNKSGGSYRDEVWLYDTLNDKVHLLASMDMVSGKYMGGDTRCDIHPRWSPDNTMICVDAMDPATETRQVFVLELRRN